jgi:steroid delta-isomerase-like uncharacterized protein
MSDLDVLEKNLDAYNRQDWQAFKETLAPDAVYEEKATHRRVQGADAFVDAVKSWTAAFPDLKGDVRAIHEADGKAFVEIVWRGTHEGPLSMMGATFAPTGNIGETAAIEVISFEQGRIKEAVHYFDMATILAQLGALPLKKAA